METHREFELLVRDYLKRRPGIEHEWQSIDDPSSGSRTELIFASGGETLVLVTLRREAIAIDHDDEHVSFEDADGHRTPLRLATQALAALIRLLDQQGYVRDTGA